MPCSRLAATVAAAVSLTACGGGGGPTSPGPSPTPSPTPPVALHSVAATVYYDLNRNNALDPDETVRLRDVVLQIAGASGRTDAEGNAVVQGVPAGAQPIVVELASLPPFFVPGAAVTVQVPQDGAVPVPVALPIGQNEPFRYLTSGDSITQGFGSDDDNGYRTALRPSLANYYGVSVSMYYRGGGGGTSADGAARIARDLSLLTPAYTLIGWGTNDYNSCGAPATCPTVENLRALVRSVKAANSLPCVATILPPNPDLSPASRAQWVQEMNGLIKAMAQQEGALVADLHAAFTRAGLSGLYVDHIHPNQAGYDVMAQAWFEALTRPRSATGN